MKSNKPEHPRPNNLDALFRAIRVGIYGKKLCDKKAIQILEKYLLTWKSPIGGPKSAQMPLANAVDEAIQSGDAQFFNDLAKGLEIRNDARLKDHLRVAEYVWARILRQTIHHPESGKTKEKVRPITQTELERLFIGQKGKKNISRIVGELGIGNLVADERETGKWDEPKTAGQSRTEYESKLKSV